MGKEGVIFKDQVQMRLYDSQGKLKKKTQSRKVGKIERLLNYLSQFVEDSNT